MPTAIGSPLTSAKNSFAITYYYENYSINILFQDLDLKSNFELGGHGGQVYWFEKNNVKAYFYEEPSNAEDLHAPIFSAVIPISYGGRKRYISYLSRGLSEDAFRKILGSLKELD